MNEKPFKLMLAEDANLNNLPLPGYLSPKLDGIRARRRECEPHPLTRSNKPIACKAIAKRFEHIIDLDGEFIYGDPTAPDVYHRTYSALSTVNGPADGVSFYVFDHLRELRAPFNERTEMAFEAVSKMGDPSVILLPQAYVENGDQVITLEGNWLDDGYEGAMIRKPEGHYKQGRSTLIEALLLKIKRRESAECRVLEFIEAQQNNNEAFIDERGHTKRSSHKENKVGKQTLGAIRVIGINGRFKDVTFKCGFAKGFPAKTRQEMWDNPQKYLDQIGTYDFFPIGCKDKPRHPLWKGLKDIGEVDVNR